MSRLSALSLFCIAAVAAERPKIGLALEGGGALGFAHLGVIRFFEKHHIPIDYIAGTSMGGLIGGFYSTGMTAEELDKLVDSLDWDDLLNGAIPHRDLTFRRKQDRLAYPNNFEMGLRHGLHMPNGLNGGHKIGLLFDRVALPYSELKSFDDLPIPFRCVSTDLLSGNAVVFREGSLSKAFRATMAIPAVFTPLEQAGMLLADGGMVNNLPVEVVKKMGADIVIAVHLALEEPTDIKSIESILGVSSRAVRVMIMANEMRSMAAADIVIKVPAGKHTSADFKDHNPISETGLHAAGDRANVLQAFALNNEQWAAHLAARQARRKQEVAVPQQLAVDGTRPEAQRSIAKQMAGHAGKPVEPAALQQSISSLMGWGRYESIGYSLRDSTLQIHAKEKWHAPPFVFPGLDFNASDLDNVRFQIGARIIYLDLGGYRSEWRTDVSVGFQPFASTEYYRPLGHSNWFVAPRGLYERTVRNLYDHGKRVSDYRTLRASFGADLGYIFGRSAELRLGYQADRLSSGLRIGEQLEPAFRGTAHTSQARFVFDNQDNAIVPRTGAAGSIAFEWRHAAPLAAGQFPQLELNASRFWRTSINGSLFYKVAGGATFMNAPPEFEKFTLGGPFRLAALGLDEMRGRHYAYSGFGYLHQIATLPSLAGKGVFIMTRYELGKMYGSTDPRGWFNDGSTGLLFESILGPFFVGGSVGEQGRRKVFFSLGRVF